MEDEMSSRASVSAIPGAERRRVESPTSPTPSRLSKGRRLSSIDGKRRMARGASVDLIITFDRDFGLQDHGGGD